MCINVYKNFILSNKGQKMAGNMTFVSAIGGGRITALYDDPVDGDFARVHFTWWHEKGRDLDHSLWFECTPSLSGYLIDEDTEAFNRMVFDETSSVARGFWKMTPKRTFHVPHELFPYITSGRWALVLDGDGRFVKHAPIWDEAASLGGVYRYYQGCLLSYAIPVSGDIVVAENDEGNRYVEIPRGTQYALWIRCSDSGIISGFVIGSLEWSERMVEWKPILVSMFRAPHIFPEHLRNYLRNHPGFWDSIASAVYIAERLETIVPE